MKKKHERYLDKFKCPLCGFRGETWRKLELQGQFVRNLCKKCGGKGEVIAGKAK